jgi:hypothetical protein
MKKKRSSESVAALINTHQRLALLHRIAQSAFKVVLGVTLGLGLWAVARRF